MEIQENIIVDNNMKKESMILSGMSCNHCIRTVEEAIKALPVEKFNVKMNLLDVEYDEQKITREQILNAVKEEGYEIVY